MTLRTCRLCHLRPTRSLIEDGILCAHHLDEWLQSPEYRLRVLGIAREPHPVRALGRNKRRARYALEDYITRVLAEREVERGRG